MGFLDHIAACNRHDAASFVAFVVADQVVGRVHHRFAQQLKAWPEIFQINEQAVLFRDASMSAEGRTESLSRVLGVLVDQNILLPFHGERYAVRAEDASDPLLLIDRAMAPCFGIRVYGQHVNAFVRSADGLKMWISRRADDRRHYPGRLDNLAAGGLPYDISLEKNLAKECWEEAGIPEELAARAVSVGAVSYHMDTQVGFKSDTLYCYDLELPEAFKPVCTDGEVQAFYLWPVEAVMERVKYSDEFKLNCNLVIIDFLLRHGFIDPDDPDYTALQTGLHPVLPTLG